jgi:prophage regulatory protein
METLKLDPRLRVHEVAKVLGYRSHTSIYALVNQGLLTKPVALGPRATGWATSEIVAISAARGVGLDDDGIRTLVQRLQEKRKADWVALEASVGVCL